LQSFKLNILNTDFEKLEVVRNLGLKLELLSSYAYLYFIVFQKLVLVLWSENVRFITA